MLIHSQASGALWRPPVWVARLSALWSCAAFSRPLAGGRIRSRAARMWTGSSWNASIVEGGISLCAKTWALLVILIKIQLKLHTFESCVLLFLRLFKWTTHFYHHIQLLYTSSEIEHMHIDTKNMYFKGCLSIYTIHKYSRIFMSIMILVLVHVYVAICALICARYIQINLFYFFNFSLSP